MNTLKQQETNLDDVAVMLFQHSWATRNIVKCLGFLWGSCI